MVLSKVKLIVVMGTSLLKGHVHNYEFRRYGIRYSGSLHHLQTSYIELNPKSTKTTKVDPYIFDTVETGRSGSLNATGYFVLKKHGSIALQALFEVKIAQH